MAPDRLRVLLIEDDDDHAELIEGVLAAPARTLVTTDRAATLGEALNRLLVGRYDAVLLDQKLPDSQFWESVPRVVQAAPRLPVIVLTSLNDLDLALDAVNQGAQDYLVKSELTPDGLLRALRYAIERKRYVAAAEESRATMALFAHAVAHEIKTPLGAARLHLTLARQEGADIGLPAQLDHHLDRAEEMVVRSGDVIRGLLAFGDAARPGTDLVDVGVVVREALEELEADLRDAGARVETAALPVVSADRTRLRQLFVNLLTNALKYRAGERPLVVQIHADRDDAGWAFAVRDNGMGMEPDAVERVFGLFQRAHDPDLFPGIGLGLALCRQIVETQGGRIWAESESGTGTIVLFTLPHAGQLAPEELLAEDADEGVLGVD